MNTLHSQLTRARAERGVALVITLFFIVIITVLAVGFLDASRMERSAANSHFERLRATNAAREGIEQVVATLRRETTDQNRNWVSSPGALIVPEYPPASQKRLQREIPLSSGAPSAGFEARVSAGDIDPALAPPDLNVQTLVDQNPPTYLLNDPPVGQTSATPMRLRWIYLRAPQDLDGPFEYDLNEIPDTSRKDRPIVARFAYWADDESSKVNYNLAWTRDAKNSNPPSHQTRIDLRALPQFDAATGGTTPIPADALHRFITLNNYQTINRFFNSPFDARQLADPQTRTALDVNKFNLTHYNSDPDTTYFAKERLMLTTKKSNAEVKDKDGKVIRTRPYLDILKSDGLDPGLVQNLDAGKLSNKVKELVEDYLKRTDWPMVDGSGSLQSKYYAGKTERLAQLALNIIDYVRSAEGERVLTEPIRGKYDTANGKFTGDWQNLSLRGQDDSYKGLTRSLQITEMSCWLAKDPISPTPAWAPVDPKDKNKKLPVYRTKFFVEIHLPKNYGIEKVDLRNPLEIPGQNLFVYFFPVTRTDPIFFEPAWTPAAPRKTTPNPTNQEAFFLVHSPMSDAQAGAPKNPNIPEGNVLEAANDPSKMVIKAGEYRTLVYEFYRTKARSEFPTMVLRGAIATGFDRNGSGGKPDGRMDTKDAAGKDIFNARFDVAPLGDAANAVSAAPLNFTLDPEGTAETAIGSYEVDDPRVNGVANDYRRVGVQSFGRVNSVSTVGKAPATLLPEQDLRADGRISDASLVMPFRKGTPENPNGRVRSAGDLGFIHTGIEGRSKGISGGGISWRTLRLQPSKQDTKVVPDWAFMDLFTVPVDVPAKASVLFAPRGSSTGGRVNMNAEPKPFDLDRIDPLAAVLYGCRKNTLSTATVTLSDAKTIATNIYNRNVSPGSNLLPKGKDYPSAASGAPRVFESPGEVVEMAGVADQGEESEELVREIANLITARGNVFSIYTIGQALKQTPAGKLLVSGEQRQQAYVERFFSDKGTPTTADDENGLRTIYFRNLNP